MTSQAKAVPIPVKAHTLGGKVFVEKPQVLEEVILTSIEHHPRKYRTEKINLNDTRKSKSPERDGNAKTTDNFDLIKMSASLTGKTKLEYEREKKDRMFPVLLDRVDDANKFLDTIEKEMILANEAKNNKIRRQYEDWNTNVHGKIQKKIQTQIDSTESKALNKKKNEDYEKFLSITNRKAAIFRDIIIESEYDPLEPNRRVIKAKTGPLYDPVKISAIKAETEASMLEDSPKKTKKVQQLGKETLAVELWASGQIEATPYGTFARMMNKKRDGGDSHDPTTEAKSATLKSHIVFDHFSYPKGKAAIDKEMPRGKRIHPESVVSDPGRIFGSLNPQAIQEIRSIKLPENRIFG